MSTATKNAIMRALLDGVLTDLMIKTTGDQVFLDENTTLSAKLAEMILALNAKALASDLNNRPTTSEMNTAISTAISGLIGGAPETYDTLKEIADYISEHEDVVTALNSAIGSKADKTIVDSIKSVVDALGSLSKKDKVSETDLSDELKTKINSANTSTHSHSNKTVLDGITAAKVSSWDSKSRVLVNASQPSDLSAGDLWIQVIN